MDYRLILTSVGWPNGVFVAAMFLIYCAINPETEDQSDV